MDTHNLTDCIGLTSNPYFSYYILSNECRSMTYNLIEVCCRCATSFRVINSLLLAVWFIYQLTFASYIFKFSVQTIQNLLDFICKIKCRHEVVIYSLYSLLYVHVLIKPMPFWKSYGVHSLHIIFIYFVHI